MGTPAGAGEYIGGRQEVRRRRTPTLLDRSHSVWGRVVPDIPDFCRELVAALAEA
jgi:hypothetical protein